MAAAKCLIAYFSRNGMNYVSGKIQNLQTGNTQVVAEKLAALTGGTLFQITPQTPYPASYDACARQVKAEKQAAARPMLIGPLPDISRFDTVLLGYPNFWNTMPMPVWTFLEALAFSGKTIAPFCTHEGSGLGLSERDIRGLCPQSDVRAGLAIRGASVRQSDAVLTKWLKEIHLL